MVMSDAENKYFMGHPDLKKAQERVREAKEKIRSIQTQSAAQVILTLMPPAIKELSKAYEDLLTVEAKLEHEIIEERKKSAAPTDQS